MGIRKNAKFLSTAEREDFVKACVLMKADIVNPAASAGNQYSKWDEYVAIHQMIQQAFAPGNPVVNFGHGGSGSYSFLSWHRYFLFQFEKQIQSYVPGVMLPYWDWTNPSTIMTDTFLGPSGTNATGGIIQRGYFAVDKPGVGSNTTALPAWWPASLAGWRLPNIFVPVHRGGLKRRTGNISNLPTLLDIKETLSSTIRGISYPSFQNALEGGVGLTSDTGSQNGMHNGMHVWLGGGTNANPGHMSDPSVSPFDPFFYLHHCNIDRLWAMWQMDGHDNEYPLSGGTPNHNRNNIMYPWTGGAAGFGTNAPIASSIPMPNFNALGAKINADTLDFRNSFGYTYDTIAIIGIGLDRTGSMNGLTPDPMVSTAPDVTKWEAAKRGVSAFLQDCETVQDSGVTYVMAGVKTFRSLGANEFASIFGSPNYGLVKAGNPFSRSTFDSNVSSMTPGGGTPLADALTDIRNTLVELPFGGIPADEQRYLAMLTDGLLTTGSPMNNIGDNSFGRTAIFAMGFGTGLDVDYPTLASMVAKGRTLATQQVFHGENAGTIAKFYENSLAAAIGFTPILDPVIELFAGEHTHLDFTATSADDAFFIAIQGMDFQDKNWSFMLHGPNEQVLYGDANGHQHMNSCHHCCTVPDITSSRSNGRLSLIIQRGNTEKDCWVGTWRIMISYKAKQMDKMMMPTLGELLFPVSAGPIRGDRYARLITDQKLRKATRNVFTKSQHGLDSTAVSTNSNNNEACNVAVNIYARTNLKIDLIFDNLIVKQGEEIKLVIKSNTLFGSIAGQNGYARLVSPNFDIHDLISNETAAENRKIVEDSKRFSPKYDIALMLAKIEKEKKGIAFITDKEVNVVSHDGGPLHIHLPKDATKIPGIYHFGIYVEGLFLPNLDVVDSNGGHEHGTTHSMAQTQVVDSDYEPFSRLLNVSFAVTK